MHRMLRLYMIDNMIWVILVGMFILFSILVPGPFLTVRNVHFILYVASMLGLLVLAQALVLLSGNFDLSVGQIAGFSAMVTAVIVTEIAPWITGIGGIFVILAVGGLCGTVNGFFVGKLGLNAFLITLSTYLMLHWGTLVVRRGTVLGLPESYLAPGSATIWNIQMAIFILFTVAVLLHFLLKKSRFGSHIYSVGGNIQAARMAGINTGNVIFGTYTLAGVLSGLAGLLYTGYMRACPSTLAEGTVFLAFAGAIIGGISLRGGRGAILGALGGVLLLGVIDAGMTMLAIDPAIMGTLQGLLVLVAILLNETREKWRDKILTPS